MSINWGRISMGVMSGILVSFILYGSYRFYFDKPIPVVNNQTFQPGSNPKIEQGSDSTRLNIGAIGGPIFVDGKIGAFIGGLLTWKF